MQCRLSNYYSDLGYGCVEKQGNYRIYKLIISLTVNFEASNRDGRVLEICAVGELLADVVLGGVVRPQVLHVLGDQVRLGARLPEVLDVHIPALGTVPDVTGSVVDELTHRVLGIKTKLVVTSYHYLVFVWQLKWINNYDIDNKIPGTQAIKTVIRCKLQ